MNIIRNITGILIAIAILNIGLVAQAHAAESSWSLDSFYQTINNISMTVDEISAQITVTAQTNPSVSKAKVKTVKKTMTVTATAYSSSVDETDDTPFITAKGTYVRDGIVAANFLPFGTAIKIPAIYGDKIFVVEDRMNKRFSDRIDLWFPSKQEAYQFGVKKVVIEIVS
jgi:3D (Asp-Asp-Asp) domain-containing protein